LQEVSAPWLGCKFTGAWLAGRGEADLVTVSVQFVDAEHDFFLGRGRIHLLWLCRRVELDRPLLAGCVLRQIGEEESVILDNDSGLLRLVLGQRLTIAETSFQLPCSPSKSFLDAGSGGVSTASDTPMAAIIRN
jgi:hypothetical protein